MGEAGLGEVPSSGVVSGNRGRSPGTAQDRARELAERFPEARDALEFCGSVLGLRGDWKELRALVLEKGPARLREAAHALTEAGLQEATALYVGGQDRISPASFFARVMLRRSPPRPTAARADRCPRCGEPPQCGCLRPQGHGSAFFLVCGVCDGEWSFARARCPVCGEQAVFYSADRTPHVQTQACEACRRYLHVIDLGKEPGAVPLVDEIAALALDLWAIEAGYHKIHPNLAGI